MNVLDPQIRVLQHVPRWGIIRTIRQQSVAEHSYYVALYATYIAKELKMRQQDINWITQYALTHDFEEMISGDIPTPYKQHLKVMNDSIFKQTKEASLSVQANQTTLEKYCIEVIKVADLFEACMYLSDEVEMGNNTVDVLLVELSNQLEVASTKLDFDLAEKLQRKVRQTPRTYLCTPKGF